MDRYTNSTLELDMMKSITELKLEIDRTRESMNSSSLGTVYRVCDRRLKELELVLHIKEKALAESNIDSVV